MATLAGYQRANQGGIIPLFLTTDVRCASAQDPAQPPVDPSFSVACADITSMATPRNHLSPMLSTIVDRKALLLHRHNPSGSVQDVLKSHSNVRQGRGRDTAAGEGGVLISTRPTTHAGCASTGAITSEGGVSRQSRVVEAGKGTRYYQQRRNSRATATTASRRRCALAHAFRKGCGKWFAAALAPA